MNAGIGTVAAQFLSWGIFDLFGMFGIVSLQCIRRLAYPE
jgi:hypothetical protein